MNLYVKLTIVDEDAPEHNYGLAFKQKDLPTGLPPETMTLSAYRQLVNSGLDKICELNHYSYQDAHDVVFSR